MKKLLPFALSAMSLILGSCSNDDSVIPPQRPGGDDKPIGGTEVVDKRTDELLDEHYQSIPNVKSIADKVSITYEDMNQYISSVDPSEIDRNIVTGYETKLMETMTPLSELGNELRSELIRISNDDNDPFVMDSETLQIVNSLDDVQLIGLGMIVSACLTDNEITWVDGQMVGYEKVVGCLAEALGIEWVVSILSGGGGNVGIYIKGVKMLINANTATQILRSFAIRYLGVIGVAYTLYKFGSCMRA